MCAASALRRPAVGTPCPSAADRVPLHPAGIRGRLEQPILARDGTDTPERPRRGDDDVVAALTQLRDHLVAEPRLDLDLEGLALARVERAREVVRVEARRVDRRLQVEPAVDVLQEGVQRPLILLVAPGRPEGDVWMPAAECE